MWILLIGSTGVGVERGIFFPFLNEQLESLYRPPRAGVFSPSSPLASCWERGRRTPGSGVSRFPAAFGGPGPTLAPRCDSAGTPGVWLLPTLQFTVISSLYSAFI